MMSKTEFWSKWLNGDCLIRLDMVKSLPIYDGVNYGKLDKETSKHVLATLINSYLEDLADTMRSQLKSVKG